MIANLLLIGFLSSWCIGGGWSKGFSTLGYT